MKLPLLPLFLLIYTIGYCQGETNRWYFGNNAGLDFSTGNAVTILNGQLNTTEGCTTLCDANGNLLFYTNGLSVWNKNHTVMENGSGLFGDNSSSQSAIIVQKPGSTSVYYIFTTNAFEENGGFRYSQVDLSANNGNGSVVSKNVLISASTCEKASVIRHSNGQDVWIITHLWNSDGFYAKLVTDSGISPAQVISHVGSVVTADDDRANAIGYMKISNDGTKLVACHSFLGKAELFDFNTSTGEVTNPRQLCNDGTHVYGAEFSPDNNVLYISAVDEKKLYQFNLNAQNIEASKIEIASSQQNLGALQLAPNGKIYLAMAETDKLSVINNPNRLGTECDFSANSIDLQGRMCLLGLPAFNQSFLYTKLNTQNLCVGNNTAFSFEAEYTPQSITWNFGDSQTSTDMTPSHQYAAAGNYTVSVTVNYPGGVILRTKDITIVPVPVAPTLAVQSFCINQNNQVYTLSQNNITVLNGQSASDFQITYFGSLADAQNNAHPLPDNYTLTPGTVTLYVGIRNINGCNAIAPLTLTAYAEPVETSPSDFSMCDDSVSDGFALFDLSEKTSEILSGQPGSGFTVEYFADELDAENNTNAISEHYTNIANPQTVYARISNGSCFKVVSFNLIVNDCVEEDGLVYPKYFTPNGDGYHDTWTTKAIDGSSEMKIVIFDRFGKILKTITQSDREWNGTFDGRELPSDDYWFLVTGKNISEYRGHFAMKR